MSEFSKENLNTCDYEALNTIWEDQLKQLGWHRTWSENGPRWLPSNSGDMEPQSLYDAWAEATNTPDDLKLGMEKEPPEPRYRKPA